MDASTRLYARLAEIPEDPNDSESLDDLIVCAFGAFERYYLCWKTKGGEYKKDGHDLPPALNEWLNPTNGVTRDWASLQVVFGRGEEYFASDKNGKLEFKEPEVKKSVEEEEKEKVDRQALRRSRTVSFLRPLSQTSNRSDGAPAEVPVVNRRTPSISSQRASRPPSLSYSTTGSEASIAPPGEPQSQLPEPALVAPTSFFSRLASVGSSTSASKAAAFTSETKNIQPQSAGMATPSSTANTTPTAQGFEATVGQSQSSNKDSNRPAIPSIPEEQPERKTTTNKTTLEECACACHDPPLPHTKRPTYANVSVQTDPISPPARTSLRVDTFSASSWSNHSYSAVSRDVRTPIFDNFGTAPFSTGRMTNYFSNPGYQLGDSLAGGYHYYEQPVYQYQDEFGDEALR